MSLPNPPSPPAPASPSASGQTAASYPLKGHPLAGQIAAPSFVFPGTVAQNAFFLAGQVDEMALCFFEALSCLRYTEDDLPAELAALPLRTHLHLPSDLPWPAASSARSTAVQEVASLALAVAQKASFLRPRVAVLHPPQGSVAHKRRLLEQFSYCWYARSRIPLLLENVAYCDICELGEDFLEEQNLGLCLDMGHLLSYAQTILLHSALLGKAGLVHWSAPGTGDRHWPLTRLTPAQWQTAARIMARLPQGITHVLEIFHWQGVLASLPVLAALCTGQTAAAGSVDTETEWQE